jgi:hypothetical protein
MSKSYNIHSRAENFIDAVILFERLFGRQTSSIMKSFFHFKQEVDTAKYRFPHYV